MTEFEVLSKMYLVLGGMEKRIEHLEFLVVTMTRMLDGHPEIDMIVESESYKALEVDLMKRVYGEAEG